MSNPLEKPYRSSPEETKRGEETMTNDETKEEMEGNTYEVDGPGPYVHMCRVAGDEVVVKTTPGGGPGVREFDKFNLKENEEVSKLFHLLFHKGVNAGEASAFMRRLSKGRPPCPKCQEKKDTHGGWINTEGECWFCDP
jgi:hypothetical protein